MVLKLSFKPSWNIGYTTKDHLCIDLDNTSFFKVYNLVKMIMSEYPNVGDCLILSSSYQKQVLKWNYPPCQNMMLKVKRDNFHVIFDNFIGYEMCCKIIENLAYLGVINEQYIRIREMRNDMTIRVSKTECVEYTKRKPMIIGYVLNENTKKRDKGIDAFIALYRVA
jgi:hypothetical protein